MGSARRAALATACLGVLLPGCGAPQACTLIGFLPSVAVDVSAVTPDPAAIDATLCLDDECGAAELVLTPGEPALAVWQREAIPRREELEVRLTLIDAATGAEVYRGAGGAPTEVIEVNGPGCGESVSLPTLRALPDGRLEA